MGGGGGVKTNSCTDTLGNEGKIASKAQLSHIGGRVESWGGGGRELGGGGYSCTDTGGNEEKIAPEARIGLGNVSVVPDFLNIL